MESFIRIGNQLVLSLELLHSDGLVAEIKSEEFNGGMYPEHYEKSILEIYEFLRPHLNDCMRLKLKRLLDFDVEIRAIELKNLGIEDERTEILKEKK